MPLRNRVTPLGELVAHPARGLVYGNRGCLHDVGGDIKRRYTGRRWIACRLEFKSWKRGPLLQPGRFTELFFLDDATALAAGHRPCALCRRADYDRLTGLWPDLHGSTAGADAIDEQLHRERLLADRSGRRLHPRPLGDLPTGAFVLNGDAPYVVLDDALARWTPEGYVEALRRPARATVAVITPPSLLALLRDGHPPLVPLLHPSAGRA